MARAYKCDRCGTLMEEPSPRGHIDYTAGEVDVTEFGQPSEQDLCRACCEDLMDWVAGG